MAKIVKAVNLPIKFGETSEERDFFVREVHRISALDTANPQYLVTSRGRNGRKVEITLSAHAVARLMHAMSEADLEYLSSYRAQLAADRKREKDDLFAGAPRQ
jgi:hypothetical protein